MAEVVDGQRTGARRDQNRIDQAGSRPRRPRWALIERRDTSLAAGLIIAAFLVFHQPLQRVLAFTHDIEQQYHVDLVQSLVLLCAILAFHHYRKRQEARADLMTAAADAAHARLRSEELERLVGLSRALTLASDFTGLHQALIRYLPTFTRDRACAVLVCHESCWDVLIRDPNDRRPADVLEQLADRALATAAATSTDVSRLDGLLGVPMLVGVHPVGVVLVTDTPAVPPEECHVLETAAALIAISIRNVQMLLDTREHSLRDGLTGCFNHTYTLETLDVELRRAQRSGAPLSVIMFDVDRFKGVNDTYGHLAGDRVLADVGHRLAHILRTTDIKCRYGGDEFLLLLPDTPAAGARPLADSIRHEIAQIRVVASEVEIAVTASVGVVTVLPDERDAQAVLARADQALYHAKRAGRNCVRAGDSDGTLRLLSQNG